MLNVTQLRHAGDSLKREINFSSREFSQSLVKTSFFKLNDKETIYRSRYNQERYARESKTLVDPSPPPVNQINQKPVNRPAEARRAAARKAAAQSRQDLSGQNPPVEPVVRNDTTAMVKKDLKKIEHFDSLFTSLRLENRQKVITDAANNVSANTYMVLTSTQRMDYETRKLRKHEIEWHRKFTLSFACLIFLFIGAPLGAIIRKGGLGLPTVISTLLFILYYVISLIGQKFVEESLLSPFAGMWLSSFVLVIAGVFLTYQATNDSAILNIDTYLNWIREKAGLRKGALLEKKKHITGKFELIEIPRTQLQDDFKLISEMAGSCIEKLESDSSWLNLARKSFENTGYFYLLEFGIHYNSFLDQVILSKWFRNPYFEKRLEEFPLINGRITSTVFKTPALQWFALIVFPIGIIRLIHLKVKVRNLQSHQKQVMDLSAGMINLLNSSAFKNDPELMQ